MRMRTPLRKARQLAKLMGLNADNWGMFKHEAKGEWSFQAAGQYFKISDKGDYYLVQRRYGQDWNHIEAYTFTRSSQLLRIASKLRTNIES